MQASLGRLARAQVGLPAGADEAMPDAAPAAEEVEGQQQQQQPQQQQQGGGGGKKKKKGKK